MEPLIVCLKEPSSSLSFFSAGGLHGIPRRRESVARMHSTMIEAPITKVRTTASGLRNRVAVEFSSVFGLGFFLQCRRFTSTLSYSCKVSGSWIFFLRHERRFQTRIYPDLISTWSVFFLGIRFKTYKTLKRTLFN